MKQNTTRHTETRKYTHVVQKHTCTVCVYQSFFPGSASPEK